MAASGFSHGKSKTTPPKRQEAAPGLRKTTPAESAALEQRIRENRARQARWLEERGGAVGDMAHWVEATAGPGQRQRKR